MLVQKILSRKIAWVTRSLLEYFERDKKPKEGRK